MICIEKIQRLMIAIFIVISIEVLHGYDFYLGIYMFLFLAVMSIVWAFENFCPSAILAQKNE